MEIKMSSSEAVAVCSFCKKSFSVSDTFCPNCGYPMNGTDEQKRMFHEKRKEKSKTLRKSTNNIYWVTTVLGFMAVASTVMGSILIFALERSLDGVASFILALIYGSLAFWSLKKPFPAIVTGFVIYITILFLNTLLAPETLAQGIVLKVIIIGGFIRGIIAAKKKEQLERELQK